MSDSSLHLVERVTRVETNIADIKCDISEIKQNVNLLLTDHSQWKTYERVGKFVLGCVGAAVLSLTSGLATLWFQGRGH